MEFKRKRPLRSIEVTYSNGDTITTGMASNLTDKQMLDYFAIGKVFNIRSVYDNMQKVTKTKILQ